MKYNYLTIASLIRAQYACNCIYKLRHDRRHTLTETAKSCANQYFNTQLTTTDPSGKTVSCAGTYISKICEDISEHTGTDLSDTSRKSSKANLRKRLLGIKTATTYVPKTDQRDMICSYLDFESWDELCEKAEDLLISLEDDLREIQNGSYMSLNDRLIFTPASVEVGSLLTINLTGDARIILRSLGDQRFKVVSCSINDIRPRYEVVIKDRILIDNHLTLDNISTVTMRISNVWISRERVRSFSVEPEYPMSA